jgi:hypothetical protein
MTRKASRRNRRIAARRKPNASTKAVCIAYGDGVGRNVALCLLDVSMFGAQLAVDGPLAPGSEITVGFDAPGEDERHLLAAQVVWCGQCEDGTYRVGCQFSKHLENSFLQSL